jgi:hypothetical protein
MPTSHSWSKHSTKPIPSRLGGVVSGLTITCWLFEEALVRMIMPNRRKPQTALIAFDKATWQAVRHNSQFGIAPGMRGLNRVGTHRRSKSIAKPAAKSGGPSNHQLLQALPSFLCRSKKPPMSFDSIKQRLHASMFKIKFS